MKIFLDTASLDLIKHYDKIFPISGVTTNPSLIAKEGIAYDIRIKEILDLNPGYESVSVELVTKDPVWEAKDYSKRFKGYSEATTFKLPMTELGIEACRDLRELGYKVNMTLIFSLAQAVLAMEARANYISPFLGRVDDIGYDGMQLVEEIQDYAVSMDNGCQVIAASARTLDHITRCAKLPVDIITLPPNLIDQMLVHPLTTSGLAKFEEDYDKAMAKLNGPE